MNFEVRQLRCRMGWTQADMARSIGCDISVIAAWEQGLQTPDLWQEAALGRFQIQAESNCQMVQRQPMAEFLMREQGLCQIHDDEVVDCLADGALIYLNFKD